MLWNFKMSFDADVLEFLSGHPMSCTIKIF
jgi:hypothetical protein